MAASAVHCLKMPSEHLEYELPRPAVADLVASLLIPSSNASLPGCLFHYTSFDGLKGILEKRRLWATDTSFLNDREERKYAEDVMKAFLKSMAPACDSTLLGALEDCVQSAFGSTYVTCFCEDGDLLSMWRGYAGRGGGYSIGFDRAALRGLLNPTFETFGKIVYAVDLPHSVIERFKRLCESNKQKPLTHWDRHGLIGAFAQMLVLIKHPAFREEQEWRIVIPQQSIENLQFRSANGAPIPYLEIPVWLDKPELRPDRLLPIKKVFVGPTLAFNETSSAIRQMLEKYGHPAAIEVLPSAVPFRS